MSVLSILPLDLDSCFMNAASIANSIANDDDNLDAVIANGMVLRYLNPTEKTRDVVVAAVKSVGLALAWAGVWQSDPEIVWSAVAQDGRSIAFLPYDSVLRTPELCEAAVAENWRAIYALYSHECTDAVWRIVGAMMAQTEVVDEEEDDIDVEYTLHSIGLHAAVVRTAQPWDGSEWRIESVWAEEEQDAQDTLCFYEQELKEEPEEEPEEELRVGDDEGYWVGW